MKSNTVFINFKFLTVFTQTCVELSTVLKANPDFMSLSIVNFTALEASNYAWLDTLSVSPGPCPY